MQFAFGALLDHSLLKALAFQSNPKCNGHLQKKFALDSAGALNTCKPVKKPQAYRAGQIKYCLANFSL